MSSIPGDFKIPSTPEINMDGGVELIRGGYSEFIKQLPEADGLISKNLYKQVFTFLKTFLGRLTTEIPLIKESRCPAVKSAENLQKWMSRPQPIKNGVNAANKGLDIFNNMLGKSNSQGSNLLGQLFRKDHRESVYYIELMIKRIILMTDGWSNIEKEAASAAIELFRSALLHDPNLTVEYSIRSIPYGKSAKPANDKLQGLKETVAPGGGDEVRGRTGGRRSRKARRAAKAEKTSAPRSGGAKAVEGAGEKLDGFRRRVEVRTPEKARIPESIRVKF